jgi:hypothetical protein
MWLFSTLGIFGLFFSWRLHRSETGPEGRGLETITTKSGG